MTKDELRKEATSTVEWENTPMLYRPLFVLAYIAGAEPREKRINELENELKQERKNKSNVFAELNEETAHSNELLLDEVADLKKENTELKEKLEKKQNLLEKKLRECRRLLKRRFAEREQLTKAKELLKRYVKIYVNPYPEEEIELRNEAEQFLKEVSE